MGSRISELKAELSSGKKEHAKICERPKLFMDAAEEFNGKSVSSCMLKKTLPGQRRARANKGAGFKYPSALI